MKNKDLESFIVYSSFATNIEDPRTGLSEEEKNKTYAAIVRYGAFGTEDNSLSGAGYAIFNQAKIHMDINKANRENGRKGGLKAARKAKGDNADIAEDILNA